MNMYRAAIMHIDRHLLSHMFPLKGPSDPELKYNPSRLLNSLISFADLEGRLSCQCQL